MEPPLYRARKWAIQRLSSNRTADQHRRLNADGWDVVVVLDACRYDVLADVADWVIGSCRTPETSTGQWLPHVAANDVFRDAAVVTANPQYDDHDVTDRRVHRAWEDHWRGDLSNVPPEPLLETTDALLAEGQAPVVAHLLPPHAPYIGKLGGDWRLLLPEVDIWGLQPFGQKEQSTQAAMAEGKVDMEAAWQAYRASVASVWNVLTDYLGAWLDDGHEIVVTADHGEAFGRAHELFLYEHPAGCHIDPLRKVPYVHLKPGEKGLETPESTKEHLEALGYR